MILDKTLATKPVFFLIGTRVVPNGTAAQKVAVLVARDVVGFNGAPLPAGEVLIEDIPFKNQQGWKGGPLRYEAEIAPYKPVPDAVVVTAVAAMPGGSAANAEDFEDALEPSNYGSVEVGGGGVFGAAMPVRFGWVSRLRDPRKQSAGEAGTYQLSMPLPVDFRNDFFNGQGLPGQALLDPGRVVRFTRGLTRHTVTIPSRPELQVLDAQGAPLQPPASMTAYADTVVLDLEAQAFTIVWRAVLSWEERFKAATLKVH